ncbi:MAG: flagellar hook-associated protein 3, partial [Betaproteobacteria bacterium]
RPYQDGATISLARQAPPDTNATAFDYGIDVSVTGAPANGDKLTVAPSTNEDVFVSIYQLIQAVESATPGATGNTRLANALNSAQNSLDNSLEVALTVQASVGARTKEIETSRSNSDDLGLQYQTTLGGLQDLDMVKALSDLAFNTTALEAAQKSFVQIQGLSLFNYL